MINTGLIRGSEDHELNHRWNKLPVQVKKGFEADQILKSAVGKHADHD